MAGTSISSLILFIAAMLVAAAVAGTLVASVTDISDSIDVHSGDVRDQIDTDIEIISDAGSDAVYDESEGNITLLIKNTGERTLSTDPGAHDVLVNGEFVTEDGLEFEVVSDDESWRSGAVVSLEIDGDLEATDRTEHRVVVDVGGDREVFEFYHE